MTKINRNHVPDEKNRSKPRILVAPLDWGLGHATRCIPVIYELLAQNAEVWLAGEKAQLILLNQEFPGLRFLHLEGYRVKYARSAAGLLKTMLFQAPRIFRTIKKEQQWLQTTIEAYGFDAIISDNRFGLYHSTVPCFFITHQLRIRSPFGRWTEGFLQKLNYRFINRFTACWVPDYREEEDSLAGELSHPLLHPSVAVQYIGPLSRLKKNNRPEKKNHLFISISGPEPQRTLFENIVVSQVSHYNGTATIVRGLPGVSSIIPSTNDIRFYNHLPAEEYNREMEEAAIVIARSGYSTVMDIQRLGKKSILVPTPGQTEQEYLARHLEKLQLACAADQKRFVLEEALQKARKFSYRHIESPAGNELADTIGALLSSLTEMTQI